MKTSDYLIQHFEAVAKHELESSFATFEQLVETDALFVARDTGDTFAVFKTDNGFVTLQASPLFMGEEPSGLAGFQVYQHSTFSSAVQCVADVVIADCSHFDE